jgi:hypothetical protein
MSIVDAHSSLGEEWATWKKEEHVTLFNLPDDGGKRSRGETK